MIVYIAWDDAESKPLEFPRNCPCCHESTVIGHGWRERGANDICHITIRIHRGRCKPCHLTITMLPRWLIPGGHYSWKARQQAEQLALEQHLPTEQCIPEIADPRRSVDPSTVRRWFRRRWESLMIGLLGLAGFSLFAPRPTLFAWDWKAASRILSAEAKPP